MAVVGRIGPGAEGFYTAEVRDGKGRSGFEIITLAGERRMMASKALKSSCRVGTYGVDVEAIDQLAAGSVEEALKGSDIIVIDEIGKMEMFSEKFKASVLKALDSDKPVIGVILEPRHPFADLIKSRKDVRLVEVTLENRDRIPGIIKKLMEK